MKDHRTVIITGLSGSGKSTAMAAFEDAGFYCVDNMPMDLLPKFLDLPMENDPAINGFAFVMDMRARDFLLKFSTIIDLLGEKGHFPEIIFLEADEDTLLKRYSQTRRHHPLSQDSSLMESIHSEKEKMLSVRRISNRIIDTSGMNVHQLKSQILSIAQNKTSQKVSLKITVLSFGFKYGIPHDADMVMDMRFLANPYFIPELRHQDGESEAVRHFVMSTPETGIFLQKYLNLIDFLIPMYKKEGKAYLTLALGCTGGRHRSVALARRIFEHLQAQGLDPGIIHRDIDRDTKES
ncbi:MAG: RNase adapter RapZ [Pseudomonadota bacterium]